MKNIKTQIGNFNSFKEYFLSHNENILIFSKSSDSIIIDLLNLNNLAKILITTNTDSLWYYLHYKISPEKTTWVSNISKEFFVIANQIDLLKISQIDCEKIKLATISKIDIEKISSGLYGNHWDILYIME